MMYEFERSLPSRVAMRDELIQLLSAAAVVALDLEKVVRASEPPRPNRTWLEGDEADRLLKQREECEWLARTLFIAAERIEHTFDE